MEKKKTPADIEMDQLARQLDSVEGLRELGREATKTAKADNKVAPRSAPFKK